jgi:hypothetical protein
MKNVTMKTADLKMGKLLCWMNYVYHILSKSFSLDHMATKSGTIVNGILKDEVKEYFML